MNPGTDASGQKYVNSLTVYILVVWSAIVLLLFGNSDKETIAQILVAPFLLDISKGVGDTPALWFRGMSLVTLLIVIALIIFRIHSSRRSHKLILSFSGIVATTIHYGFVGLGYMSTGLH